MSYIAMHLSELIVPRSLNPWKKLKIDFLVFGSCGCEMAHWGGKNE
jgi:hypothetical protein